MHCVFCEIIARRSPGTIRYEDDDVIAFDNILGWAPVMMLVIPKQHLTQEEMWQTCISRVGPVAVALGRQYCPGGFRLLSNLGRDAMQSQYHAHIHVVGGTFLGPYV